MPPPTINPSEFERRIRKASQLRGLGHKLREGMRRAYAEGRSPYPPANDLRSDYDYWRGLAGELSPPPSDRHDSEDL